MKTAGIFLLIGLGLMVSLGAARAATTVTTLASFTGTAGALPGKFPEAQMVQGRDGNFYGTTVDGGTGGDLGSVFKLTTNGICTMLVSFNDNNGSFPEAGLALASDGNFYGTTTAGTNLYGTIFRVTTAGVLTQLYVFNDENDGYTPNGLVQGANGLLYGTTYSGGANQSAQYGTVFVATTSGGLTNLFSFNYANGANPQGRLVQASDGNFYGTTAYGGTNGGWGTVFKITPGGQFSSLVSFNGLNGANPLSGLVAGPNGMLYGTTSAGGPGFAWPASAGNGTVFAVTTNGQLTTLHFFTGYPGDGYSPEFDGLMPGSDGNFYGTTVGGGSSAAGTLFVISPAGNYTNIYSFNNASGGNEPEGGLVQGNDGSFYGTTAFGGAGNFGTVFKLTVPLNPPANWISAVNVSGANVLVTVQSVWSEIYQLQYEPTLPSEAWVNVNGATATGIGGPLTLTNFGGFSFSSSVGFFRYVITP